MAKIFIESLAVPTYIGVHAYEKKEKQTLLIDLNFSVDVDRAALHDRLADTVNYAAVRDAIVDFAARSHFHLIETFAKQLSDFLKKKFQLNYIELSVTKFPKDFLDSARVKIVL